MQLKIIANINKRLEAGIENITIAKVTDTNVLGKEVLNTTPQDAKIDISNLNSGIYMVSIQTENASKNIKLIKQ